MTNTSGTMATAAGTLDNRLSLNPSDPQWSVMLAAWQDGGEYTVTATIRQVSPGEFEVVALTGEEEVPVEEAAPEEVAPAGRYKNPAVSKLAASM